MKLDHSYKKVLLIYPGNIKSITKRMPLSVLFIAESLIQEGYDPVILDMQVDSFYPALCNDIICAGISTLTGEQIRYGIEVAKLVRATNPKIPIVWGGIHPSIMPEQTLEDPLVDYIVIGEGEEVFPKLITAINAGVQDPEINSVAYIRDNKMKMGDRHPFINFNKINKFPYELLNLAKYQTSVRFEYQSSRGCPHGCLFCYNKGFNLFKWRHKSADIVLGELEMIKKRFNPHYLFFVDDEFFINKKRAYEIVNGMIEREFGFLWKASIRIDTINSFDRDFLELIHKSGCFEMPMGAESGSDDILSLIKKKVTNSDILESAKHIKGTKLVPQYSFMSGFPGEKIDDLYKTLDCIDAVWRIDRSFKINGLFYATPFPGTDLFELAMKNGYVPPGSLREWGDVDFISIGKNLQATDREIANVLWCYAFIIRFRYLWMHSGSFIADFNNILTKKYWEFVLFHLLFYPFSLLFKLRWAWRFVRFPIDILFVKRVLSKIPV